MSDLHIVALGHPERSRRIAALSFRPQGETFFQQEQDFESIKEALLIEKGFLPAVEMTV